MRVTTRNGSVYEFDGDLVVRYSDSTDLRRDQEWVRMLSKPIIEIGRPMVLELEPLGECDVTVRITSGVVSVE